MNFVWNKNFAVSEFKLICIHLPDYLVSTFLLGEAIEYAFLEKISQA